jgi:hypothetical protein
MDLPRATFLGRVSNRIAPRIEPSSLYLQSHGDRRTLAGPTPLRTANGSRAFDVRVVLRLDYPRFRLVTLQRVHHRIGVDAPFSARPQQLWLQLPNEPAIASDAMLDASRELRSISHW